MLTRSNTGFHAVAEPEKATQEPIPMPEDDMPKFTVKATSRSGNEMQVGVVYPDGDEDTLILSRHYK